MGGKRLRVPKNSTALAQAGDRPGANQAFKRIVNEVIMEWNLQARLEKDFQRTAITGMSKTSRIAISNLLVEVRHRMNSQHAEKIRNTFSETCLPAGTETVSVVCEKAFNTIVTFVQR